MDQRICPWRAGGGAKKPPLNHPCWLVACSLQALRSRASFQRVFVQADILDRGPDNHQATVLRGEDVDLISALPHIAEEAFNSIGGLNVPMHPLRKGIKGQEMLFVLSQASQRLWIALAILGFEG